MHILNTLYNHRISGKRLKILYRRKDCANISSYSKHDEIILENMLT